MAVTFRGVNGLAPQTNVSSSNPPKFASQAAGDLIFTELFLNAVRTVSITAGWEILFQGDDGAVTYAIAFKVAANTTETPTWSWSGNCNTLGSNNWDFTGQWSGGRPIGATSHKAPSAASTTIAKGPLTVSADNSFIISWDMVFSSNQSIPIPSGYANLNNFSSASSSERCSNKTATPNHGDVLSTSVTITSAKSAGSLIEVLTQAPAGVKNQPVIIW